MRRKTTVTRGISTKSFDPGVTLLLLPIAHAAGGAGDGAFWERFLMAPPLHPILVNFTAALIPISLLSDVLGRVLKNASLRAAGWWTLLFGTLITPFTAIAGWLWHLSAGEMHHDEMLVHRWLGTAIALLLAGLLLWRWRFERKGLMPSILYLAASALLVLALTVQGHLGGMMSFGQGGGDHSSEHGSPSHHTHEEH